MNYNTIYIEMDVYKENFYLCCYINEKKHAEYPQKVDGHYSKVLNYLESLRFHYGDDAILLCGYEAGCLGFTLYYQLTSHSMKCIILAPTTMPKPSGKKSEAAAPRVLSPAQSSVRRNEKPLETGTPEMAARLKAGSPLLGDTDGILRYLRSTAK